MPAVRTKTKSEETRAVIMDAALALFRQEGFDKSTMRGIAENAGVATGAAYYYYPSKEAIVLEFFERSCEEMRPVIAAALENLPDLDARLRELIRVKLHYFQPNRSVLRALLRTGADPGYPLSPFSSQTKDIRDIDIAWFGRILVDSGVRIPKDLKPMLPGILWFFQMGIILFWVVDDSPDQVRTQQLLELSAKSVVFLIRASALPFLRPLRKTVVQLVEIVRTPGGKE